MALKDPLKEFVEKVSPENKLDFLMRLYPHTYAQYMTEDPETGISSWVAARHLAYISKRITEGIARGNARIIVNMPARHGKSMLISKWLPIWFLEHNPQKRIMVCSYGADLAHFWGRQCRDEIEKNKKIRLKLQEDSKSIGQWNTKQGGGMKADGVGGGITGWGFDLGLIDDPHKDYQDACSPTVMGALKTWYQYTFFNRHEPNSSIVVLMHRWISTDFCGYLMEQDTESKWEIIRMPAIAEEGDVLGRKPGEALWPERWNVDSFAEAKRGLSWNSMFQQDPQNEAGDRVYDHYTQAGNLEKNTQLDRGPDYTVGLTLDFNINPGMHGLICQYNSRSDIVTFHDEIHGERWRTEALMKQFILWCVSQGFTVGKESSFPWKCVNVYGDRSGRNQSTVTTDTDYKLIMRMLKEAKIPFRICVPAANPPINDRVITMNEALQDNVGEVHFKVNPRCKRLLNDLGRQRRDENGQPDKSDQSMGHAGDAAGYFVYWVRPTMRTEFKPQRVVGGV